MSSSSGFTLIEVMVVLAVVVVVLVIGAPGFQAAIANQRANSSVNDLLTSVRLARSESIKTVRYVTVCKSDDGLTCGDAGVDWEDGWIVFVNLATPAAPATVDTGDQIVQVYPALSANFTLRPLGTVDDFVSFRPTGSAGTTALNHSGTLTLCDPNGRARTRAVIVEASGGTRVSDQVAHDGSALVCP